MQTKLQPAHTSRASAWQGAAVCVPSLAAPCQHSRPDMLTASASSQQATRYAYEHKLLCCTNKVCRRQGSKQVLKFLQDLSAGQSAVVVEETGCLGGCGSGPNIMLLPEERVLSHVATTTDAAQVLKEVCGVHITPDLLKAIQLRLAGNEAAMQGDLPQAIGLYDQALHLDIPHGQHLLYSNRSAALLQLGRKEEALADAQKALHYAPPDFTTAWVRVIDCLYALGRMREAAQHLKKAEASCPPFKSCQEYQNIVRALKTVRL